MHSPHKYCVIAILKTLGHSPISNKKCIFNLIQFCVVSQSILNGITQMLMWLHSTINPEMQHTTMIWHYHFLIILLIWVLWHMVYNWCEQIELLHGLREFISDFCEVFKGKGLFVEWWDLHEAYNLQFMANGPFLQCTQSSYWVHMSRTIVALEIHHKNPF